MSHDDDHYKYRLSPREVRLLMEERDAAIARAEKAEAEHCPTCLCHDAPPLKGAP